MQLVTFTLQVVNNDATWGHVYIPGTDGARVPVLMKGRRTVRLGAYGDDAYGTAEFTFEFDENNRLRILPLNTGDHPESEDVRGFVQITYGKSRPKSASKRDLITKWSQMVDEAERAYNASGQTEPIQTFIRRNSDYARLKPLLGQEALEAMGEVRGFTFRAPVRHGDRDETEAEMVTRVLRSEVARLEREWSLI